MTTVECGRQYVKIEAKQQGSQNSEQLENPANRHPARSKIVSHLYEEFKVVFKKGGLECPEQRFRSEHATTPSTKTELVSDSAAIHR